MAITAEQREFIGKLLNIEKDKRVVFTEGVLAWIHSMGVFKECDFVADLHSYILEHGAGYKQIRKYVEQKENKQIPDKEIIFNGVVLKVRTTGYNYDFIATLENLLKNQDIIVEFFGDYEYLESIHIKASDWVGIFADETGNAILKAIKDNKFEIVLQDAEEQPEE